MSRSYMPFYVHFLFFYHFNLKSVSFFCFVSFSLFKTNYPYSLPMDVRFIYTIINGFSLTWYANPSPSISDEISTPKAAPLIGQLQLHSLRQISSESILPRLFLHDEKQKISSSFDPCSAFVIETLCDGSLYILCICSSL